MSQTALANISSDESGLRLGQARGLVASSPNKTTTVTLRLTGPWYQLWEQLKQAVPNVGDAEIVRRGVALYMALEGLDSKGQKPHATIQFHDDRGDLVSFGLKEYVGLSDPPAASAD